MSRSVSRTGVTRFGGDRGGTVWCRVGWPVICGKTSSRHQAVAARRPSRASAASHGLSSPGCLLGRPTLTWARPDRATHESRTRRRNTQRFKGLVTPQKMVTPSRTVLLLTSLLLVSATGCQSTGLRFLSLIGLQKDPLIVALVADNRPRSSGKPLAALNPFAPYSKLQAALGKELGRPVGLDLCLPLQLEPSLSSGLCHLAIVSPIQYARLSNRERFTVLAVPIVHKGCATRSAVLVVKANSPLTSVEDLRGKTVAFGPAQDSWTHHAALVLLAQHGLQKTDLALELLPLPGSLKHMPNAAAVAQTVINNSSDAGFIDERDWEELPPSAAGNEPAHDKLRVVARTIELPERLVLASPKLARETAAQVRSFLLKADQDHPQTLHPLQVSAYQAPREELLTSCQRLIKHAATDETSDQ